MKWIRCLIVALLLVPLCGASAAFYIKAPFSGHWHWKKANDELDLYLQQTDKKLQGRHTAIGQGGAKVDEVLDDQPPSIEGTADGYTAVVSFRSGFPEAIGHGKARMTLHGKSLYWTILESSGEFYLPLKAVLKRVKESPPQSP